MSATRIVITGMGAVTGFGFEWQTLWEKMLGAEHCVRPWQPDDLQEASFAVRYAAPVDMRLLPEKLHSHPAWTMPLEKRSRFGWVAATQAVGEIGRAHV